MENIDIIRQMDESAVRFVLEHHVAIRQSQLDDPATSLLVNNRLASADGTVSRLCQNLAYHAAELDRQAQPQRLAPLLKKINASRDSRVLDVGCGAGQSLFLINASAHCPCFGVDHDQECIEFGKRINELQGNDNIQLCTARGNCLPFDSASFSHVVSRVALNYMHQKSAIQEMVRVLRPGGTVYLHVENAGTDLKMLFRSKSIRTFLSRSLELGSGIVRGVTGFQLAPDSFRGCPGRLFVSNSRISGELNRLNCPVRETDSFSHMMGIKCASSLVARKRETAQDRKVLDAV